MVDYKCQIVPQMMCDNCWVPLECGQFFFKILTIVMPYIAGTHPTNDISIEFEIQWKFVMLLFIRYSAIRNKFFHMSRQ